MVEGLAVDLVHLDGTAVLTVRGDIDMATASTFGSAIERTVALGVPVVLDFAGVTFMDSSGLNALVTAHQRADRPGAVQVRNPSPQVSRLLAMTGLDDVFAAHATVGSHAAELESDALVDNNSAD
jgi:anti-anti-sigma factor